MVPKNGVERVGTRGERFSLGREEEQEEKLFLKNGFKREGERGEGFPLQRRRVGGKSVPQEWSQKRR